MDNRRLRTLFYSVCAICLVALAEETELVSADNAQQAIHCR
jgi:hypothetical protein